MRWHNRWAHLFKKKTCPPCRQVLAIHDKSALANWSVLSRYSHATGVRATRDAFATRVLSTFDGANVRSALPRCEAHNKRVDRWEIALPRLLWLGSEPTRTGREPLRLGVYIVS